MEILPHIKLIHSFFPPEQGWNITPITIGHSSAYVFYIQRKAVQYVLKVSLLEPPFLLRKEYENLKWFAHRIAVPRVIWYRERGGYALLLSERIDSNPSFLFPQQAQIGNLLGRILRQIHELSSADFPNQENKTAQQLAIFNEKNAPTTHWEAWDAVLSHGDYCLPNILLDPTGKAHLIDLGEAGLYDRYHDLFWGMWSLDYNGLKDQIIPFLQAYGMDKMDYPKMKLIAQINGKALDFMTELTIFE